MSNNAEEMRKLMQRIDSITSSATANLKRQLNESVAAESWDTETKVAPSKRGMFKGKTVANLRKQLRALKKTGPHKKGSSEYIKMRELQFAIRAKTGWGKVSESSHDFRSWSSDPNSGRSINLVHALIKFSAIGLPAIIRLMSKATPAVLVILAAIIGGEIGHTGGDLSQIQNDVSKVLDILLHGTSDVMDESEESQVVDPLADRAADQGLHASTTQLINIIDHMTPQEKTTIQKIASIIHNAARKINFTPDSETQKILTAVGVDT